MRRFKVMENTGKPAAPTIGDYFPKVSVHTTLGPRMLPEDYSGKWLVLFSHPGDFTPVCTTEFIAFEQWKEHFDKINTELIGLSVDQVYSHLKWIEWIKDRIGIEITFPVIADPLGELAALLGMIRPNKSTRPVRGVFVLDDKGIIRQILYYPQEIGRNISEIWRSVNALQTASKHNVATPENWPQNNIIGSDVIIPPASSVNDIYQRYVQQKEGQIQCFDWWFCHKPLMPQDT
jgi:peroxiredoxin (alkyl hydroperoxide reductase subunit C)